MGGDVDGDFGGEGHAYAVCLGDLGEIAVGAAVHVRDGDDMAPCRQRLQDDSCGGRPGGESESVFRVLQRRDGGLEVMSVRVRGARVLVCADGDADGGLGKGGGEGDGGDDGAGDRVVGGSGVHGEGAEAVDGGGGAGGGGDGVVVVAFDGGEGVGGGLAGDGHYGGGLGGGEGEVEVVVVR